MTSPYGTVTVSMPYWRTPHTITRAAVAVLGQTHRDLRLVVTVDGDPRPPRQQLATAAAGDPRVTLVVLHPNRGRYFCDAAALAAATTPWFAIHDADDWADPHWLETLLATATAAGADAAVAPQWVHTLDGRVRIEPVKPLGPLGPRMDHLAHHAALYRTEALRAVGIHPGHRIGYDTLLINLLAMTGRVAVHPDPLYHRVTRPGSLTTSPTTRHGSPARRQAILRLTRLYTRALAGEVGVVTRDIAQSTAAAVATAAAKITATMATPSGPGTGQPVTVLDRWPPGAWVLPRGTALELAAALARHRPRTILEAGSGTSTLLLAEYARQHPGVKVVTLEQHHTYGRSTAADLTRAGLRDTVDLRTIPLAAMATPDGGRHPWYHTRLPDRIDLALIDGPTQASGGRHAALTALMPHLAPGWQVWLDDADRPAEQATLAVWTAHYGVHVRQVAQPHGLAVITATPPAPAPVDAGDVTLTLLTGRRPQLLTAGITALLAQQPGLLESAHVIVMHNGGDQPTAAELDRWPWIDQRLHTTTWVPVGPAMSRLVAAAAAAGRPHVLHLEDDWVPATVHPGWLPAAVAALTDPAIGQVRLRHRGEPVLTRHMVTGAPIVWTQSGDDQPLTADAHWTLNPALMRTGDLAGLWPATGEGQAAARFAGRWQVAQATPGVWVHTGAGESLEGHRW